MEQRLTALADPLRWKLVGLLAERPRSVGVLAQLSGARQPQTTKHLQALERAGLISSERLGQRRIYSLRPETLREVAVALARLADSAEQAAGNSLAQYRQSVQAERLAASTPGWADGRSFQFHRRLQAPPDIAWQYLVEPSRLATWWAPADLRVSDLVFDAIPGGRIVLEYRDRHDRDGTGEIAGRAEGSVEDIRPFERLAYRLSPLSPSGDAAFTSHVEYELESVPGGTDISVRYGISDRTIDAADFIAGIEIGFGQSLDQLAALVAFDAGGEREPAADISNQGDKP